MLSLASMIKQAAFLPLIPSHYSFPIRSLQKFSTSASANGVKSSQLTETTPPLYRPFSLPAPHLTQPQAFSRSSFHPSAFHPPATHYSYTYSFNLRCFTFSGLPQTARISIKKPPKSFPLSNTLPTPPTTLPTTLQPSHNPCSLPAPSLF